MQRRSGVLAGVSALVLMSAWCAARSGADDAAQRKRLEGRWTGQVVDGGGERGPVEIAELLITADRITGREGAGRSFGEGSYRLEAGQPWSNLDATGIQGPTRGRTFLGIYSLEGDTLKWCVSNPGKPRPTELVSRATQGQYLMILKRARP